MSERVRTVKTVFKVSMDVELSFADLGGRKRAVQLHFDPHQGKS